MGAGAYNRGSRIVSREADARMPGAVSRADRQAQTDEIARLRGQVAALERELRRARRCLAAERLGREQLRVRLGAEERANAFGVGVLCRIAFPGDDDRRGSSGRRLAFVGAGPDEHPCAPSPRKACFMGQRPGTTPRY